jgi:hypothetical protein
LADEQELVVRQHLGERLFFDLQTWVPPVEG